MSDKSQIVNHYFKVAKHLILTYFIRVSDKGNFEVLSIKLLAHYRYDIKSFDQESYKSKFFSLKYKS